MYRIFVQLGRDVIQVEGETLKEVLKERAYLLEIDRAREGEPEAELFYRTTEEGYEYFGFRRPDGAEVTLGQHKQEPASGRGLYAYGRTSDGYKGWERYDREKGERIPMISDREHDRNLFFIRAQLSELTDAHVFPPPVWLEPKAKSMPIGAFIRKHKETIKTDALTARAVARAIERATGVRMET